MNQQEKKAVRRSRRKHHIRRKLSGTAAKPRLSVYRSHQNIYAQLIDDLKGVTLAAASTLAKDLRGELSGKGGNRSAAQAVGKKIAEAAKGIGVTRICFDRNGYRYHGRVKALADAAREAGLVF